MPKSRGKHFDFHEEDDYILEWINPWLFDSVNLSYIKL